jgi:phosphonate transport system permease protein
MMNTSTTLPSKTRERALLAAGLSLLVPGAGQWYLGKPQRAGAIFGTISGLACLVQWVLSDLKVGMVAWRQGTTSWLWLVVGMLWVWSAVDAFRCARGLRSWDALGILLALVIVYYIGWQVTDANLDRLITRFQDVKSVFSALVHPDLFVRDQLGGWHPSENFGDLIGKVVLKPAPRLLLGLGLFHEGALVPTPVPGKMMETIAIGLMATLFSAVLALPLSFVAARNIMSRVPGGMVVYQLMRGFLNVVRSIDTLIWGMLIVVWVGLGSFAAVLALTIHSIAALGKLYSEEIEHIDPGPVEALTATGANLVQTVRYAVVPQIEPRFLAFTLLRWDINMRMATIVGVVAGGGIGFFVVETIRKGGYEQYAAALWVVALVIIVVDYVSARWRERILVGETNTARTAGRPTLRVARTVIWAALLVGLFAASWVLSQIDPRKLFQPAPTFLRVLGDFVRIDLSPSVLHSVFRQMLTTIFEALIATTLGSLAAIPFSFLAARNLLANNPISAVVYYLTRGILNILRSIEALLYVAIFVFWVGIGPFAGTLSLAITSFALVGKLFSEAIENIDPGPLEAITATGGTRLQTVMYAILPQIIPPFISYVIYQWDINVRISTIVGFAGGGGVGLLLYNYFGMLQYHKAGTVVALIVMVITVMDFASARIRQRLV